MLTSKTSRRRFLAASGALALQSAFGAWPLGADSDDDRLHKRFTFEHGAGHVLAGFTDYSLVTNGFDFIAEIRPLPDEVGPPWRDRKAYYLQGDNHSDDLFMFLKAPLDRSDGIESNQSYLLSFDLWFASSSNNCFGVGGSEDSVYLKAGGSTVEPVPLLEGEFVSINVDKGNQATGGKNLGVIGNIWNGEECPIKKWVMLHKTYKHPYPIKANGTELWIAVGTDSGYEAVTGIYYYSIGVHLKPVDNDD